MKKKKQSFSYQNILYYIFFAFTVGLFYGTTLFNGFVHDDIWQIQENQNITTWSGILKAFSGCVAQTVIHSCHANGFYYRPLQEVVYTIIYQFSQAPWIFHLANIFFGFVLNVIVFHFLQLFLKKRYAFLATIFVIMHPINAEVFNWIGAMPEFLLGIGILLMVIFSRKYTQTKKNLFLILSVIVFTVALFSKETAVFCFFLLPIIEVIQPSFSTKKNKKHFAYLLWYLIPLIGYGIMRFLVIGNLVYQKEGFYQWTPISWIYTISALFEKYLYALLYPLPLTLQHGDVPITTLTGNVILGVFLFLLVVFLGYVALKKNMRSVTVGLVLIVLPLIPVLLFVTKIGQYIFAERYLLLSSVGLGLVIFSLLQNILPNRKKLSLFFLLVYGLIFYMSWTVVIRRNTDWKNNFSSYESILRVDPKNENAYVQIAEEFENQQKYAAAKKILSQGEHILPASNLLNSMSDMLAKQYTSAEGFSFFYPSQWHIKNKPPLTILLAPSNAVTVAFAKGALASHESFASFIQTQRIMYENIINEGQVVDPSVDNAYLFVMQKNQIPTFLFFLNRGNTVMHVVIYPANSSLQDKVNFIISTLQF